MSRAREIQQKLDLQAELQKSFSGNTRKVLGWLEKNDPKTEPKATELNDSKASFFTLPVMQVGSGLSFATADSQSHSKDDIHTVGEFINSDKKVSSLSKKRKRQADPRTSSVHRISNDDTTAMVALKRKMRDAHRDTLRQKLRTDQKAPAQSAPKAHQDDTDDEDDIPVHKTTKKTMGLLFNGKKKRK